MKGRSVVAELKKKLKVKTDARLADKLGISHPLLNIYKHSEKVTEKQIAGLISKARHAGEVHLKERAIRPLVEFFRIQKCKSGQGRKCRLFEVKSADGEILAYLDGLRKDLESKKGVYVFFDSSGHAIYTGKARKQNLWKEMNLAFNRERGEVQKIKRVKHPSNKKKYRTSDEKIRQIKDLVVPLHELAFYFSAYQIDDGLINDIEAMLVRSFANNLLNVKMEKFWQQKGRSANESPDHI
jgi:hypothetical protein